MTYHKGPEPVIGGGEDREKGLNIIGKDLDIKDIEGVKLDAVYKTERTTITARYTIEKIPVPSVNNVRTLDSSSNIFNKPQPYQNTEADDIIYITGEDNYINSGGGSTELSVNGDIGTHYTVVVKDITNTKWYNFDTKEFENGYHEKCGHCGGENLPLDLPPQTLETTYNIFFKTSGSTFYDSNLPTENDPWVIKQLANVVTTFRFGDSNGFTYDQVATKTHLPGDTLNSGSINDGKINITITTIITRGVISLSNAKVQTEHINTTDDNTVILDSDLIASASGVTGTITGTITLGKSAIRDTDILFNTNNYFTIT